MLHKVKPTYSHVKVFSCVCYLWLRPYHPNKIQFRSSFCTFLGFGPNHKGYQCLDKHGRVFISRHVTFDEALFLYQIAFSSEQSARGVHHRSPLPVVIQGSSLVPTSSSSLEHGPSTHEELTLSASEERGLSAHSAHADCVAQPQSRVDSSVQQSASSLGIGQSQSRVDSSVQQST